MANDEQNKAIPQVDEVKLQPPKLSFEAITFSDGTTLKLDEDDIVVFVGPNNAGKSAALHELEERVKRSTPGLVVKNSTMSKKGTQENSPEEQVAGIAECIQSVLSLRTAQIRIDEIRAAGDKNFVDDFSTRCRFALRFGDIRDDNNQALVRADSVRDAFNSPFRPFILASAFIGQEGLDFHTWCHAVVHWNLPSNPVDFEQREGRVHRYKGHAVRKNVAERFGLNALSGFHEGDDPWQTLFRIASQDKTNECSDLVPYWIFEEGSARVERRIPLLPYSKEVGKLKRLNQGLALYRMVIGQPRQEDLLFSLSQNGSHKAADFSKWLISASTPSGYGIQR